MNLLTVTIGFLIIFTGLASGAAPVTFHRDIEPLLQASCQSCHRPGEVAPMSLMTYQETRKWAAAIKEAVTLRQMPPWYADPSVHQKYAGDPTLSAAQIETIRRWVDGGAPEGNAKDAPAPRQFVAGWNIEKPDLVIRMPQPYQIPAIGTVEYTYIILPSHFKEDMWVTAAEVRPGDRPTMHHAVLYTRGPESKWLSGYPVGVPFVPAPRPGTKHRDSNGDRTKEGSVADEWLVDYAPGASPWPLPEGSAFLVRAGSDFVLQLHYTPNGKPATDQTEIGLKLSKKPPAHRAFLAVVSNTKIEVPAGDPNYTAEAARTLASDVKVLGVAPHMHLRGKAMELRAVYPAGEKETLVNVPKYDFSWQETYMLEQPKLAPKGTRLEATAIWDNSANNRRNPDPTATVRWGDQSSQEMMTSLWILQIDPAADLDTLFEKPKIIASAAKP